MREQLNQPSPPAAALPPGRSFLRYLLVLILVVGTLARLTVMRMPVTYPEGDFVMNVMDVVHTGHVASTFTPDTYPYLAGLAYRSGGLHGFLLLQAALYLLLAGIVLWLVRSLSDADPVAAGLPRPGRPAILLCALAICLDPDLLSAIPKVWDTGLTCLVFTAFAALCVAVSRRSSPALLCALATVWGVGISVRPNFALLLLPVIYSLSMRPAPGQPIPQGRRWTSLLLTGTAIAAWGLAIALLINRLAHGSFYLPQNGPYNLFAGANPFTQASLLRIFNAEDSIRPALAALGIHLGAQTGATDPAYSLALRSTYTHQALLFIARHPLEWLWLGVVKLMTLLRPDTKAHAMFTIGWGIKVLTSLCVPLWLITLAAVRRLEPVDKLMLMLAAAYILPFLLTNADPRFRPALDVLVLAHAAGLLVRRLATRPGRPRANEQSIDRPVPAGAA